MALLPGLRDTTCSSAACHRSVQRATPQLFLFLDPNQLFQSNKAIQSWKNTRGINTKIILGADVKNQRAGSEHIHYWVRTGCTHREIPVWYLCAGVGRVYTRVLEVFSDHGIRTRYIAASARRQQQQPNYNQHTHRRPSVKITSSQHN